MIDFYQKRKLKTLLEAPLTRVVLLILVILMAWSAYSRFAISREMEVKRNDAQRELQELKQQREVLEKKVQYLSDERGIEAEMRRQFDVALNDEQVVVIVEPDKNETNHSSSTYQEIDEPAWYQFWR